MWQMMMMLLLVLVLLVLLLMALTTEPVAVGVGWFRASPKHRYELAVLGRKVSVALVHLTVARGNHNGHNQDGGRERTGGNVRIV
uniref:Putative secreted protein n=1 Tax=Anopheles darlingi TaxID=43151 RepID=A0A2M4DB05_ANODA